MERRLVLWLSIIAFAIVLAVDVLYIALINSQGRSDMPYIPRFVGGYLAVMAAMIAVSLLPRPEVASIRVLLRAAAAAGLFVLGFLAALSIGPPLVLAGFLVTLALTRTAREPRKGVARLSGLVAAAISVAVLLVGLEVTQRLIVCPEAGTSGGGGSGFLTGPYQYECDNGVLRYHSG
ncbi:MAG TPA: hypothetical protein VJR46_06590 [Candidatus Dormibacteraeota bacterium]|nr:hypothetical protein [Candidatus Dormibacteraeota bacterium]